MSRVALPIDDVLPDVVAAVRDRRRVVVEAPPGAGKTTRVPPALMDVIDGRIVVLEPRRVAARAAARRMATERGEAVGRTIGLTTREDRRTSGATRVEVVTEGVLVRRLQHNPGLPGIGAVILDEFHERSLDADLALAFTADVCSALREDLRVVVMSATLDGDRVAALLDATVVRSDGRLHPVQITHVDRDPLADIAPDVAGAIEAALARHPGDVLVFLPGMREIRSTRRHLRVGDDVDVVQLHGSLPGRDQDRALAPATPGRRKVVLSTDLAESSVTVPGVRVVVDAGLSREPRLDPRTGMTRLVTVRASQASADQRAGRAGRLAPGWCVRLWSRADHGARDAHPRPEIVQADLSEACLQVAAWGADVAELVLLDAPPARSWEHAQALLRDLGAVDDDGRITAHGRALAGLPLHPRLGHLVVTGAERGDGATAVAIAALLGDRDPLRPDRNRPVADLAARVRLLDAPDDIPPGADIRRATLARVRRERDRLARLADVPRGPADPDRSGALLALAYPDRVGMRRGRRGTFTLSNGRGCTIDDRDSLADAEAVVVADVDDRGADARVHLAAAVALDDIRDACADRIDVAEVVTWDPTAGQVVAEIQERLGTLVLQATPLADPPADLIHGALLDAVRDRGLAILPWDRDLRGVQQRATFVRSMVDATWPDFSDAALLDELDSWLRPFLAGARRLGDLRRVPLRDALEHRLGRQRVQALDRLAPTHLTIPSGSRIRLSYDGDTPVLAVKLQEMFGATDTPRVGGGAVPVVVHLLSPAGRPLQVTSDLAGFWANTYAEVRAEMRGRYPKHPWPEDPRRATPTARTKKRPPR